MSIFSLDFEIYIFKDDKFYQRWQVLVSFIRRNRLSKFFVFYRGRMWGKVPPRRAIFNLNSWKCLELWHMILTMASSNTEQIPINKLIVLGSQVVHGILYLDWNSNVNLSTKGDSNFVFLLSSLKTNFHDKCSCKWWGRMTQGGGEVRQMLTIAVWEPLNLAGVLCGQPLVFVNYGIYSVFAGIHFLHLAECDTSLI